MDLNIFYVEQANFLLLIRNEKALLYDCGSSTPRKFERSSVIKDVFGIYLINVLRDVKDILIVISHTDSDHSNILVPFKYLLEVINNAIENNIDSEKYGNNKKNYFMLINEEKKRVFENYSNFLNADSENNSRIEIKAFIPSSISSNDDSENNDSNNENLINEIVPPQNISNDESIILKIIGSLKNEKKIFYIVNWRCYWKNFK